MDANNAEAQAEVTSNVDTADSPGATESIDAVVTEQSVVVEGDTETSVDDVIPSDAGNDLVYDFEGEEVSVATVKDWKENGLRQSDYTKKSQANADTRKTLDAEKIQISELRSGIESRISALDEAIKKGEESIDWEDLRDHDPSEYLKQKELITSKKEAAAAAKSEASELANAEDAQLLAVEQQLLSDAMPTWADPKQREADVNIVESYVKDAGFTEGDFSKLTSHRLMLMAIDAAKYKALQGKTAETGKTVQKAPNVVKATQKSQPKKTTRAERFYG